MLPGVKEEEPSAGARLPLTRLTELVAGGDAFTAGIRVNLLARRKLNWDR